MSIHNNYIEGYGRNRNKLCNEKIIPFQDHIFLIFSNKFYSDAEKDGNRGRKLLESRGNKCGDLCKQIHKTFQGYEKIDIELNKLVKNIVNLDYNSLSEIFQSLKSEYSKTGNNDIINYLNEIINYLTKMRKISKSHTTINKKKILKPHIEIIKGKYFILN